MRKTFIAIALFAMIGTLAVSCQKENVFDNTQIEMEQSAVYKVCYSIDGVSYRITLIGDGTWHDFLNRLFDLAEAGHTVSFRIENSPSQIASSKEVVTYTTTSHDDAYKWAEKMGNEGYNVTVTFDERTGIYTCTAIR